MGRCLNTLIMCDILKVRKPDHPTCLGLEQRGSLSTWWACMTHIVYIIQVSVRTLLKIARFAIFSRQIIFLDHICCTYDLKASLYENLHSSDVFLSRQKFHIYLHFVFNTWDLPVYLKNTWQIILSARFVGVLRWPPPRRNKLGPRDSMSP